MTSCRRAFTLIEVMVALVVGGLVVSLAYAALQGGLDTRERLLRHREEAESMVSLRATLLHALRHAVPGATGGSEVFALVDRTGPSGPADSLAFLTRGIVSPYGTSVAWRASLSVGVDGLHFVALPAGTAGVPPVSTRLRSVSGLDVRVLGRGASAEWTTAWRDAGLGPQAVALTIAETGHAAVPLVARVNLERAP